MDSTGLVVAALVFGAAVGAGLVMLFYAASRHGERVSRVVNSSVPEGVQQVINVLRSAGVVIDPSNTVIMHSEGAAAMGLIAQQRLTHESMQLLVNEVRHSGETTVRELEVPKGPFGSATLILAVRVARLGTRYVLLLAEDFTEAHRLNAVRRDFIANISHELKTPIGAVSLLAEALEASAREPEQVKRFAKRLSKESERLTGITSEIIELSRLQSADALTTPKRIELDGVIAAAIDQHRVKAESVGTQVVSGGEAGVEVFGDESMLVAAVQNLISNAIVYSPPRSRVGVGVNVADGIVEVAVTDQGIGMEPEDLDRVFERFYRVDQARSRHTGGTGLGLAIVKHVAENHGGEVRVWSKPGRGSTFTLRLPQAVEPAPAMAEGAVEVKGEVS